MAEATLAQRFRRNLFALLGEDPSGSLLVALSGGLDSTVLLHLLRFGSPGLSVPIRAAHFDHRMRADSGADAAWVRGLCRAWGVEVRIGVTDRDLRGEADARDARHTFLRNAADEIGATSILTAHHADDQAETVLFRLLRGSGLFGIRGIPDLGRDGLVRPLLPFWRREIAAYASGQGIRWREDSSNERLGPTRNRIRHVVIPRLEELVSPAARRNLVGLAREAAEAEAALDAMVKRAARRVLTLGGDTVIVARDRLREYDPAVASRVLRKALRRFGTVPHRIGTRSALTFITDAPSGREMSLAGGVRIRIEYERARIDRHHALDDDIPFEVDAPPRHEGVEGTARIGGRSVRIRARRPLPVESAGSEPGTRIARFDADRLVFPLRFRSRRAGDRIRLHGGTRTLKRLMIDRRIPGSERSRIAVMVDAEGRVLWVPGVARSAEVGENGESILEIMVDDVERR